MRMTSGCRSRSRSAAPPWALVVAVLLPAVCHRHDAAADAFAIGAADVFDLQGFLDDALASGSQEVRVPPGRYRVHPHNAQHLVLRGLEHVVIDCTGVEMICSETTRAITIAKCKDLTLRGLVIDYDPLPFTQGRITRISPDSLTHEIAILDGYPRAATARLLKYEVFDPETRRLRCLSPVMTRLEVVDDDRFRVTKSSHRSDHHETIGDLVAIAAEHAPGGVLPHAVVCAESENVVLEDIDLYSSNCFGFFETNCAATTYRRCRYDRRTPETEFEPRDPRLRSGNADAFHSTSATIGPRYLACVGRSMGDDGINICGDYHLVMKSSGATLRVLAKRAMNLAVGDVVELVTSDGDRLPDARVEKLRADVPITSEERHWLRQQRMDHDLRTNSGKALVSGFEVTLDRTATLPRGSLVASTRHMGRGFEIRQCTFGFTRSRGIIIKASHGIISDCVLEGCWQAGILVSPDRWWLEAGSASEVSITNNVIRHVRAPGIVVTSMARDGRVAPAGCHTGIQIEGNCFEDVPFPCILCTSTKRLTVASNRFPIGPQPQAAWGANLVPPGDLGKPVVTIACTPNE